MEHESSNSSLSRRALLRRGAAAGAVAWAAPVVLSFDAPAFAQSAGSGPVRPRCRGLDYVFVVVKCTTNGDDDDDRGAEGFSGSSGGGSGYLRFVYQVGDGGWQGGAWYGGTPCGMRKWEHATTANGDDYFGVPLVVETADDGSPSVLHIELLPTRDCEIVDARVKAGHACAAMDFGADGRSAEGACVEDCLTLGSPTSVRCASRDGSVKLRPVGWVGTPGTGRHLWVVRNCTGGPVSGLTFQGPRPLATPPAVSVALPELAHGQGVYLATEGADTWDPAASAKGLVFEVAGPSGDVESARASTDRCAPDQKLPCS